MIPLQSRGEPSGLDTPIVGVVRWLVSDVRLGVYRTLADATVAGAMPWALVRTGDDGPLDPPWLAAGIPQIDVRGSIQPLLNGDIVALQPSGRVDTLFRGDSDHNSLFVTEQCNSYCLMCSQPPRNVDDIERLLATNARAVRLMPKTVEVLGITGGEPTLLGGRLADLITVCRAALPKTQLEILSNGRKLGSADFAQTIAAAADDHVLFTIPLYADNAPAHDYVVQASGAFVETVGGLYNAAALGIRCELRVVLHRETASRLPQLARFIQKNLPFVEQVAFMGLEMIGLARANEQTLWIEPPEYMDALSEAVTHLTTFGMRCSIYNLQLCLVPPSLWPHCRRSISDWKREYAEPCSGCSARAECGGLFGTSSRVSQFIHAI